MEERLGEMRKWGRDEKEPLFLQVLRVLQVEAQASKLVFFLAYRMHY